MSTQYVYTVDSLDPATLESDGTAEESESDSNDEMEEGPRNDNEAKSLPNMSHRCCSFPQHCSFLFPMETKDDGWIAGGGTTDAGKGTAFLLASTFSFSLPARPSIAAATFPLKAVRH
ncbi:uncharacterized protein CCOS01_06167 [Colletotrichum costaricense]|uniref:Uncharacterized protein n=1 Tax=Colletotrichum costaricense TaxID=1209916 RepID=A0AAI9Z1X6_9PEZI|nr:uncharacterized protein CCOS01_06167 [Colletotrichum costaricense]KAK1531064.1 hypothetical protein CCOS01_06167 [Colletotrichum costaricense]